MLAILAEIASFINFKTPESGITNKRVIVKVGFIQRNSIEVLLNKVEGVQVNQGILGGILVLHIHELHPDDTLMKNESACHSLLKYVIIQALSVHISLKMMLLHLFSLKGREDAC